jgi:hypothetical protein
MKYYILYKLITLDISDDVKTIFREYNPNYTKYFNDNILR